MPNRSWLPASSLLGNLSVLITLNHLQKLYHFLWESFSSSLLGNLSVLITLNHLPKFLSLFVRVIFLFIAWKFECFRHFEILQKLFSLFMRVIFLSSLPFVGADRIRPHPSWLGKETQKPGVFCSWCVCDLSMAAGSGLLRGTVVFFLEQTRFPSSCVPQCMAGSRTSSSGS